MRLRRKQTLMDRASEFAETVLPQIESALESALETGKEQAREAQAKAAPLIAQGRQAAADKASTGAAYAAEKGPVLAALAAEKAAAASAYAAEKAPVVAALAAEKAAEGRDLAVAKANELRGIEPEPEKGGRLKKLLLVTGLLAIGGLVFSRLRGSGQDSWQSSYTPTPTPPRSTTAPTTGAHAGTAGAAGAAGAAATDDIGGGTPGEAVADAVEEPHRATTPDDPATIIDVDDVPADDSRG